MSSNHKHIGESLIAILICMSVASMLFASCFVYKSSGKSCNWMVTIMILLILSALVRLIERFNYTDSILDPKSSTYGTMIGLEVAFTWAFLLVSEFCIAMKYF